MIRVEGTLIVVGLLVVTLVIVGCGDEPRSAPVETEEAKGTTDAGEGATPASGAQETAGAVDGSGSQAAEESPGTAELQRFSGTYTAENRDASLDIHADETGRHGGQDVSFSGSHLELEEPVAADVEYEKSSLPADMIDVTFSDVRWKYRREDIVFSGDGTFHWNEREGSDHLIERIGSYVVESSAAGNRLSLHYDMVINGESQGDQEEVLLFAYDSEILVLYTTGAVEAIFKSGAHNLEVKDYEFFANYELYPTDLLSPYFENYFAEGGEGPGTGLDLNYHFSDLNAGTQISTPVTGMILFNGITKDYSAYIRHNRIESVEMILDSVVHHQAEFPDTPIPQIVRFPQKTAEAAVLTVEEVYRGSGEENILALSKVYFFGDSEEE
jgi:hypothetical protein